MHRSTSCIVEPSIITGLITDSCILVGLMDNAQCTCTLQKAQRTQRQPILPSTRSRIPSVQTLRESYLYLMTHSSFTSLTSHHFLASLCGLLTLLPTSPPTPWPLCPAPFPAPRPGDSRATRRPTRSAPTPVTSLDWPQPPHAPPPGSQAPHQAVYSRTSGVNSLPLGRHRPSLPHSQRRPRSRAAQNNNRLPLDDCLVACIYDLGLLNGKV